MIYCTTGVCNALLGSVCILPYNFKYIGDNVNLWNKNGGGKVIAKY